MRQFMETKDLQNAEICKMRDEFKESVIQVEDKSNKLSNQIIDVKYWIEQYNESFKKADGKFNNVRTEFLAEIKNLEREINQKCGIVDLRANLKEMSDLVLVKFKQLEDMKEALRDMLLYQKYFYPVQM